MNERITTSTAWRRKPSRRERIDGEDTYVAGAEDEEYVRDDGETH